MSNRTRLSLANSEEFASALSPTESAVLATVLATLSLATVTGNALVMLSFLLDRRLRTHTNSFLLSLAAADMLIGALSMPLFSQYLLRGKWTLGRVLCDLWLSLDHLCSTASYLNLLLIGLDRYLSVKWPLRYRARRTGRQVALAVGGVWVTSFLMWPPWIWSWQYIDGRRTVPDDDCYVQFLETNFHLTMVTSVLSYYLPMAIMLVMYHGIWRETRNRKRYLAGMEVERHCGRTEQLKGLPQSSRSVGKSTRSFLERFSKLDHGSATVSSEAFTYDVGEPSKSVEISSNPAFVPLRLNADDKSETLEDESHSIVKDKMANGLDESASSETKNAPLADVSPSREAEVQPNDTNSTLILFRHKADEKTDFTQVESNSSTRDKDETVSSRVKSVPLAGISLSNESTKPISKKLSGKLRGESKAARVLTAILLVFIVTITPMNVIVIIDGLEATLSPVPDTVWYIFYFLTYVNSTLNPVCYALANRNFKRTYWKILTCSWSQQGARKSLNRSLQHSGTCTTHL